MMKKGSGKSTNTLNLKGKGLAVKQLKGSLVLLGMGNFLTLPDPEVSIPGATGASGPPHRTGSVGGIRWTCSEPIRRKGWTSVRVQIGRTLKCLYFRRNWHGRLRQSAVTA